MRVIGVEGADKLLESRFTVGVDVVEVDAGKVGCCGADLEVKRPARVELVHTQI